MVHRVMEGSGSDDGRVESSPSRRSQRAATADSSDVSALELLRSRLFVYSAVMGGMMLAVVLVVVIGELVYRMPAHWLARPSGQMHLGVTLALLALAGVARSPLVLTKGGLQRIDVAITCAVALQIAGSTWFEVERGLASFSGAFYSPQQGPELKSALTLGHLLMLRA